jgi:hypothetical protein
MAREAWHKWVSDERVGRMARGLDEVRTARAPRRGAAATDQGMTCEHTGLTKPECSCHSCLIELMERHAPEFVLHQPIESTTEPLAHELVA